MSLLCIALNTSNIIGPPSGGTTLYHHPLHHLLVSIRLLDLSAYYYHLLVVAIPVGDATGVIVGVHWSTDHSVVFWSNSSHCLYHTEE